MMAANISSGVIYENRNGCGKVLDVDTSSSGIYENCNRDRKVLDAGTRSMTISETPSECGKDKIRAHPGSCVLLVCLGILCALLVGGIIWVSVEMTKYETSLDNKETEVKNLKDENQQLMADKRNLENQTDQLSRERDDLNWTLGAVLTYNNFPVNYTCPNKLCQLCQNGWILFQGNCYLFSKVTSWIDWSQSRQYCQGQSADLVVINNLEEQIFVSNHSEFYLYHWYGYWLGLQQINNTWTWVDGHEDTLRYWMPQSYGYTSTFARLIPRPHGLVPPVTQNWDSSYYWLNYRFICEREALIRAN